MKKIALLFLTRNNLHHVRLWEEWIDGFRDQFSIYVHPKEPELVTDQILLNRLLPTSVETTWGGLSLVEATLALLKEAFKEDDNEKFVLLSESCVPIRPAREIAERLSADSRGWFYWRSYRDLWEDGFRTKCGRYLYSNRIGLKHWHYCDQWFVLSRNLTEAVLRNRFLSRFKDVFAPDEIYFATVLHMLGFDFEHHVRRIRPTYANWNRGAYNGFANPYTYDSLTEEDREELKTSESLFARKFARSSDIRSLGLHLETG